MTQPAFPLRGVLAPLAVVLVLGIVPLAAAEVSVSPGESLLLQVGERSLEVQVGSEFISGSDIYLFRTDDGLSGLLHGQPVKLTWNRQGNISGQVVGRSVTLSATRLTQPGLTVRGWFGADTAELALTPTAISGSVEDCGYSLSMAAGQYSGWRTCAPNRGPPVRVTLRIPESFVSLGTTQEGALLTLLLSDEGLPPASPPAETPGVGGAGTPSP
ncbi:hypothetical protein [Vitiosangium sp. GDMCC 1.1324]|uniref:hypothetical protein n=1 Tax=Vitiosangium sp. (strain GDMCC 1.1324) TaxID=2138576 RepID=UPI000D377CC5|nr:hypothetical protein [Vitiosangium sp. GDMCC 1.1324]PTL77065.1 hypothetical protein DAT35_46320 [Vitiosangium sp. GDMCC 1.1324]